MLELIGIFVILMFVIIMVLACSISGAIDDVSKRLVEIQRAVDRGETMVDYPPLIPTLPAFFRACHSFKDREQVNEPAEK